MGLKDAYIRQRQRAAAFAEEHKFDARFAHLMINGDQLKVGFKSWPVAECHAELVLGGQRQRVTVTRVGAGALLFGPAGAVIGALAKKDATKNWLIVATPAGVEKIEVSPKQVGDAQAFASNLEQAASRAESTE